VYVENSETTIGAVYKKAVYRQYTSAAFATLAPRPPTQGLLGPTLHAEAGDKLVVVFRNALSLNTSLAIGGGLLPANASARDAVLQPNETFTYEWVVPASAAPGPQDPSTVAYTYYSGFDTAAQLNAGLMGALVVGAQGALGANDLPKGARLRPASLCSPCPPLLQSACSLPAAWRGCRAPARWPQQAVP
jgi:FtsP/CotA-like multicopper oxidase with cupredoxin domain